MSLAIAFTSSPGATPNQLPISDTCIGSVPVEDLTRAPPSMVHFAVLNRQPLLCPLDMGLSLTEDLALRCPSHLILPPHPLTSSSHLITAPHHLTSSLHHTSSLLLCSSYILTTLL